MTSYMVVLAVGIILVLIFGLISFLLTSSKVPDLPEASTRGDFESADGEFEGAGSSNAGGYSPQMIDEMRQLFKEQNRQSFWKSIWVSSAFYFLGAITSAHGATIGGIFQAVFS